jgi:hypothetical protein
MHSKSLYTSSQSLVLPDRFFVRMILGMWLNNGVVGTAALQSSEFSGGKTPSVFVDLYDDINQFIGIMQKANPRWCAPKFCGYVHGNVGEFVRQYNQTQIVFSPKDCTIIGLDRYHASLIGVNADNRDAIVQEFFTTNLVLFQ